MGAAFAFDQGALATLGLRRTNGARDPLATATVGLMCLPLAPVPPVPPGPTPGGGGGGGGGGTGFFVVPPYQQGLLPPAPGLPADPVVEDVPVDLAVDVAGDLDNPFARLAADLALIFAKKPRT